MTLSGERLTEQGLSGRPHPVPGPRTRRASAGQRYIRWFVRQYYRDPYNGLGRHDAARDAAWRAFERDQLGYGPLVVPELAEAASRTGDVAALRAAREWLSE